jgi:long-chain acyl-CoA synthetase
MNRFDKLTFSAILPLQAKKYGSSPALRFLDEKPVSYAEMYDTILALQAFFVKLSLKKDDKVIILGQNMPNWGMSYFALQCSGIIAVPALPDFNHNEITNILSHSEANAIIVSTSLEYKLKDIDFSNLKAVIRMDDFDLIHGPKNIVFNNDDRIEIKDEKGEDELSILLYTSGTTGNSKGVMLSQKNVILNAIQGYHIQTIHETSRFLSVLPLSHTYENTLGLILPIISGGNVTYLRKAPTAPVLLDAMKKVKPELMLTVPMIMEKTFRQRILPQINSKWTTRTLYKTGVGRRFIHRSAGKKLYKSFGGHLIFFGIGGSKLDAKTEQFLREAKFPYAIGYGLTESAPILAGSNPNQTRFQAIGPVVKYGEIKIMNPDPKTGEGEIIARGPNIMLGYYKNEEETKKVFTDDGWFRTGDLGVFDKDGWLSHKGRIKNVIVGSNGENIYPEEVESLINTQKHVLESLVIEQKGKLVAMVHFNMDELNDRFQEMSSELRQKVEEVLEELATELHSHINARLNKFSQIQAVIVQPDPFQKTATQKIKRYLYS